jgi:hypothetical protein
VVTDHRHVPVETVTKDIEVSQGLYKFTFQIKGKRIKGIPESIRSEHSCCLELKEKIKLCSGIDIPLKQIYMKIQAALWQEEQAVISF